VAALAAVVSVAVAPTVAFASPEAPQFYSNSRLLTTAHVPVTLWGELELFSAALGELKCHDDVMSGSVWNEEGHGVGQMEGFAVSQCTDPTLENPPFKAPCTPRTCGPYTIFATGELPVAEENREAEICREETKPELRECPSSAERVIEAIPLRMKRRIGLPWKLRLIGEVREEEQAVVAEVGVPRAGETCYPKEIVEGREVAAEWQKVPGGCMRVGVMAQQVPIELVAYGALKPRLVNGAGNGLDASRLEFENASGRLVHTEGVPEIASQGTFRMSGSEARELIKAG
jgi:hypothetical protein